MRWERLSAPTYLVGEGWAPLEGDPGASRERAKARALTDLARQVKVEVKSTLVDILGEKAGQPTSRLESTLSTYAELTLPGSQLESFRLDYPHPGVVACRVGFPRSLYDEQVRDTLRQRRESVWQPFNAAAQEEALGHRAAALENYGLALEKADAHFPGLPLEDSGEDLRASAKSRLSKLGGRLTLRADTDTLYVDETGDLFLPPQVWVGDPGEDSSTLPREKWLLEGVFVGDPGQRTYFARSNPQGLAVFQVKVDAFMRRGIFLVRLAGTPRDLPGLPQCRFTLKPRPLWSLTLIGPALTAGERHQAEQALSQALQGAPELLHVRNPDDPWSPASEPPPGMDEGIWVEVYYTLSRHPDTGWSRAQWKSRFERRGRSPTPIHLTGSGPQAEAVAAMENSAREQAWRDWIREVGPAFKSWLGRSSRPQGRAE